MNKLDRLLLISTAFCVISLAFAFTAAYTVGAYNKECEPVKKVSVEEQFCSLIVQTGLVKSCTLLTSNQQEGLGDGRIAKHDTGSHR